MGSCFYTSCFLHAHFNLLGVIFSPSGQLTTPKELLTYTREQKVWDSPCREVLTIKMVPLVSFNLKCQFLHLARLREYLFPLSVVLCTPLRKEWLWMAGNCTWPSLTHGKLIFLSIWNKLTSEPFMLLKCVCIAALIWD